MATIKDKIAKLLALASSPNENEAKAALLKAKELMAKNKLTDADFEDAKNRELRKILCEEISWTTDSGKIWMTSLCQILCDNYCCSASWYTPNGTRTHQLVIAGIGEDTEVCREIIKYAVEFMESAITYLQRTYRRQDPKAISNSYANGFVLGLEMAFEEQNDEHPEWGLVVTKPDEVRKYEDQLGTKDVKTKQSGFDPLSYMRGYNDGEKFNSRKVIGQPTN